MIVLPWYKISLFENYFLKCYKVKRILIPFNCFPEHISNSTPLPVALAIVHSGGDSVVGGSMVVVGVTVRVRVTVCVWS